MTKPADLHETPRLTAIHTFTLQVRPGYDGRQWTASLEAEGNERLMFTSPLELARFLTNLDAESGDDATKPSGLR